MTLYIHEFSLLSINHWTNDKSLVMLLALDSESSVGGELLVEFNANVTSDMIDEAQRQLSEYLTSVQWQPTDATDGKVYPVIETPQLLADNDTGQ